MKNIELKVKVNTLNDVRDMLVKLDVNKNGLLHQLDTYFHSENGRLKLRETNNKEFELIYYERPDGSESKMSTYEIISFSRDSVSDIKSILRLSNGIKVIVEKERELWLYKNTRIHLDNVNDLGEYIELETVVKGVSMLEAWAEHKEVVDFLKLSQYKKCDVSYSDLLLKKL